MGRWGKGNRDETPEEAEDRGSQKGVKDAWCIECHEWYDSSNDAQVNRHAH